MKKKLNKNRNVRLRIRMEINGYTFIWGYSAFRVSVRRNGVHIGTFSTDCPYEIPKLEI